MPPPTSHTSSVSPTFSSSPPALAHRGQPGIDGGLRLFEQHELRRQAGRQRRFARQLAGRGIERRRHGEHDDLLGDRRIGKRMLPGRDQMLQIPPRRRDGRNLRHVGRRVPGQDRLMAIDPAVAEPRLGAHDGSLWDLGRLPAGQLADHDRVVPAPRQIERRRSPLRAPAPDRGTTAASCGFRRRPARRAAESAAARTCGLAPLRAAHRPARCSSCRGRCRECIEPSDFYFRRRDDESCFLGTRPRRKFHGARQPTVMSQLAAKWSCSGSRTGQLKAGRVITLRDFADCSLLLLRQRLEGEKPIENRSTVAQNIASCCPNFLVRKICQRLLD